MQSVDHQRRGRTALLYLANRRSTPEDAERALQEARRLRTDDLPSAFASAWRAVAIARRHGGDLLTRALAECGNIARIANRFQRADELLAEAFARPCADRGILLDLHSYSASLRETLRDFTEALDHLDSAMALASSAAERTRLRVQRAIILRLTGYPASAVRTLRLAAQDGPVDDPRLMLALSFALAAALVDAGHRECARVALERCAPLSRELGALDDVRFRWLQGYVAAAGGELWAASCAYREVLAFYESAELPFEAALARIELAVLVARAGRCAEAKGMASQVAESLSSLGIGPDAQAARLLAAALSTAEPDPGALFLAANVLRLEHHPPDADLIAA